MNRFFVLLFVFLNITNAQLIHEKSSVSILGIRVSFLEDNDVFSTGNGNFLYDIEDNKCGDYTIDPPPHNRDYFKSQLNALNNSVVEAIKGASSKVMSDDSISQSD